MARWLYSIFGKGVKSWSLKSSVIFWGNWFRFERVQVAQGAGTGSAGNSRNVWRKLLVRPECARPQMLHRVLNLMAGSCVRCRIISILMNFWFVFWGIFVRYPFLALFFFCFLFFFSFFFPEPFESWFACRRRQAIYVQGRRSALSAGGGTGE